MRKTSAETTELMRATFVVPRDLVDEFRALAKRRDRTLSSELRQVMRAEIDREAEQAAA